MRREKTRRHQDRNTAASGGKRKGVFSETRRRFRENAGAFPKGEYVKNGRLIKRYKGGQTAKVQGVTLAESMFF